MDRDLKWHNRFLDMCRHIATWSKDRSTKTGCVLVKDRKVLSVGYNGFTPGIDDEKPYYHDRPQKYWYTEHCDRNAIYSAARNGIALEGATMYLTGPPCCDCARGVVMSGLSLVVWPKNNPFENPGEVQERWRESVAASLEILEAGGVQILRVE